MKAMRALAILALLGPLAVLGWHVVRATRVDKLAETNPEAALRLDPDYPEALLMRARRQLAGGDDAGATATAKHLLKVAPGQGDAFAIIALAAQSRHAPEAEQLLEIAAQRAPRVAQVRARLATVRLQTGDLQSALTQLDALLRFEAEQGERFLPAMVLQSADPRFADGVTNTLARRPPWRRAFLRVLNENGTAVATSNIYARLKEKGGLSEEETRRWLDGLIAQGRWGEAFSAWFGTLHPMPARIPPVRNGEFEEEIDGVGFGWRNVAAPGVFTDIEAGAGRGGSLAAHIHFIGRPAPRGNLRQALLLAPGRYRLSVQARAEALATDPGLTWVVRCDRGRLAAISAPLKGTFGWRTVTVDFEIPDRHCEGQWLELRNQIQGSAQAIQGDLWIDDVAITPLRGH